MLQTEVVEKYQNSIAWSLDIMQKTLYLDSTLMKYISAYNLDKQALTRYQTNNKDNTNQTRIIIRSTKLR